MKGKGVVRVDLRSEGLSRRFLRTKSEMSKGSESILGGLGMDDTHFAWVESSAINKYPQVVYRPVAPHPIVQKRIHRLLDSLRVGSSSRGIRRGCRLAGEVSCLLVSSCRTCTRAI